MSAGTPSGPAAGPSTLRGSVRAPRAADVGAPTTLVVARHARTANTERGRFAGRHGEDAPLSEAGEREAARLADAVARLGGADGLLPDVPRPDLVVASPMRRTRRTAELAAAALGLGADDVVHDEGWVEASFGVWEDLTYREIAERYPDELAAWQGSMTTPPPGGDSLADTVERVRAARRALVGAHAGRCVLVVTHATCVRVVVHEALAGGDELMWRLRISPAALSVVRYWSDGGVEVATANATAHLAGL